MTPMRRSRRMSRAIAVCAAALFTGCSPAWRAPIYQKQGFQMQWVDKITLLPPSDARIDKSTEVNLDEQLRNASVKNSHA